MHDILNENDTALLIDAFYRKVVADPVIGFLFTDIVALSWEEHIPIMNDFWNAILLGTGSYRRNPMIKHLDLDRKVALTPVHFERWLLLWEQTLEEHFQGPTADHALQRAKHIASVMQHKIEQTRIATPDPINLTEYRLPGS